MTDDLPAPRPPTRAEQMIELGRLSMRTQRDGDIHTITLSGEIDIASAGHVEQELMRAEATDAGVIVLDLTKLSFIDSSGIRMLLMADGRRRADSCRLVLRPPPETVLRVLRVAGVEDRLPFVDAP